MKIVIFLFFCKNSNCIKLHFSFKLKVERRSNSWRYTISVRPIEPIDVTAEHSTAITLPGSSSSVSGGTVTVQVPVPPRLLEIVLQPIKKHHCFGGVFYQWLAVILPCGQCPDVALGF